MNRCDPENISQRYRETDMRSRSLQIIVIIAIGLLATLVPPGMQPASASSAHILLQRLTNASTPTIAYLGTSETISASPPSNTLPLSTARDIGRRHSLSSWEVADPTHYRIDTHVLEPALESQTLIDVVNGTYELEYWDIAAKAWRYPVFPSAGRVDPGLGLGPLSPRPGDLKTYVSWLKTQKGTTAAVVGQETYLGRTADILEVRPALTWGTETCSGAGTKQRCTKHKAAYGERLIWVDDQYLVPLQAIQSGVPDRLGGNFTYRVMSISFGQGPSPEQLAYSPPVTVQPAPNSWGGENQGTTQPNAGWQPPTGYIPAGLPVDASGRPYTKIEDQEEDAPPFDGPSAASVVFAPASPRVLVGGRIGSAPKRLNGPYVYIQERIRENGPPALFQTGTEATAGSCTVRTGQFTDGVAWLGLMKDDVALLATSNELSQPQLVSYTSEKICK
jgi:hypothetical protein